MQRTGFYRQILGIASPRTIISVDADMVDKRLVIRAEAGRMTKWFHFETKLPAALHKWVERSWRHLDTRQFEAVITGQCAEREAS